MDKRKIERFFASDLYKTFMAENKVRREFKFSVIRFRRKRIFRLRRTHPRKMCSCRVLSTA